MQKSAAVPTPRQDRSRRTAQCFVDAAMRLLRSQTFAELSVGELAGAAERSVGAFYQRFGSKDDFLIVLLDAFFERAEQWRMELPASGKPEEIYLSYLHRVFRDIAENRNLWHAALGRSASDPDFWGRFGPVRERLNEITRQKLETARQAPFTPNELRRLAIAGQVFNSVINNQIINGPGPLDLDDPRFFDELSAIVLAIAPLLRDAGGRR